MTDLATIVFAKPPRKLSGTVVVLVGDGLTIGPAAKAHGLDDLIRRAAGPAEFHGKLGSTLDLLAPAETGLDRLIAIGAGKSTEWTEQNWLRLGGIAVGSLGKSKAATVLFERPDGKRLAKSIPGEFALGAKLRAYSFDKYKTPSKDENGNSAKKEPAQITVAVADLAAAKSGWAPKSAIANGVLLARDLINEPANVLGPMEFVQRINNLKSLGVSVEVLTEKEMQKLGMRALLAVAQGSPRPPRIAVMRWNGGKAKDQPLAFVGKGVVFDTGGISIKPAGSMEDMKGDMAGAAAVTGLMHALAARKAKVNVIGVVGLVENMPDGLAQRPGDIVKAMSGTTIEVVNTDAEGRMVLADAVHYTATRFKPRFVIDLATLTGAIIVALGHNMAGMFSSDDGLAAALDAAGQATGEQVWRMPLAKEYDKQIDSKFADIKNAAGRDAGSITGAHFIKRFVGDTPWVHLDIAGVAIGSPQTDTNKSWSSGFGVRLLDRLVSDKYER